MDEKLEHIGKHGNWGYCSESCPLLNKNSKEYKTTLKNCIQNEEMPYFNETLNEYECYPILELGPCENGYWFVLDKDRPDHAICAEQECACESNAIYDDNIADGCVLGDDYDLIVYDKVMLNGSCENIYGQDISTTLCPYGQELVPNQFGIGKY